MEYFYIDQLNRFVIQKFYFSCKIPDSLHL